MPITIIGIPLTVYLPPLYGELGIDLALMGFILLVARFSDVITDPIIGITFLVISPNLNGFQILKAFWMGGLFGLVAYGTYDLTNLATIKGWSLKVTIIDLFWGGILTAVVSSLTVWVMSKINPI